jgi:hypothetical protein
MKRLVFACIAALTLGGAAMAQTPAPAPTQNQAAAITISGNLAVINGVIGLKANGVSYYVPRLRQLVGFVKEIQEGAAVKLEGYAYPLPSQAGYAFFAITKLSVAGKDYDFGQGGFGPGRGRGGRGMRGGWGDDDGPRGMMGDQRW